MENLEKQNLQLQLEKMTRKHDDLFKEYQNALRDIDANAIIFEQEIENHRQDYRKLDEVHAQCGPAADRITEIASWSREAYNDVVSDRVQEITRKNQVIARLGHQEERDELRNKYEVETANFQNDINELDMEVARLQQLEKEHSKCASSKSFSSLQRNIKSLEDKLSKGSEIDLQNELDQMRNQRDSAQKSFEDSLEKQAKRCFAVELPVTVESIMNVRMSKLSERTCR
ncbi:hypothetical protein HYALB_00009166 [Hymenoscyphus albidus]|uniref:Uncharacterized protein n=1 Tax=Hymenoscyphus albidus TaxID=595503 RepID=A0A9N9M0E5_9HELO|nr:hypothetical protein HYALB_00009166 [Hymenoscyphus albidus]